MLSPWITALELQGAQRLGFGPGGAHQVADVRAGGKITHAQLQQVFLQLEVAARPADAHRHRWRPNDLVMWDNRCTYHAATDFDTRNEARLLYRTIVE
ncbi:MAG: TauD/TfdA family dioxygenase [Alphaproteobacteria bacterium]|nr:TauD/TfdA family dioxygenase [Alphaproteobacteria bacterium]